MEVGKTRPEIKRAAAGDKIPIPEQKLKEKIKKALIKNSAAANKAEIEFLLKRF